LKSKALRVFFIYTISLALFVIIGTFSAYFLKTKETYILTVKFYILTEYLLFSLFLFHTYTNHLAKKFISISVLPFSFFWLFDLFQSGSVYTTGPLLVEFLAFIVFIIYYFYEKMQVIEESPIYQNVTFWICVGLFLYFSGNFFFLIFSNYKITGVFKDHIRYVYTFVTISKNILLCSALLINETTSKSIDNLNFPSDLNLDAFTPNHKLN
jgi:hypothetical protein